MKKDLFKIEAREKQLPIRNVALLTFASFIFLFLISSVVAQPPFIQTGVSTEGYLIKVPPLSTFKQNTDVTLNFHVFNISNGFPISNVSTSCALNLYNQQGVQVFESIVKSTFNSTNKVQNEWEILIKGTNFTTNGDYGYVIQCNSSTLGGFDSVQMEVTPSGFQGTLGYFIIIFSLAYGISFVGFFGKNEWVTIIGGLMMVSLGIYALINGIADYRTTMTEAIALWTIGLGAFFAIFTTVSVVQDNM